MIPLRETPSTNKWTSGAAIPTQRAALGTARIGSTIYAIGGTNEFTQFLSANQVLKTN